ncbi:MAG: PAS domain S-box protein [Candidatus Omnitrophica bacterium]|nr:PAS domain S-box protein [Candidatus Omnitrophota bacterium]
MDTLQAVLSPSSYGINPFALPPLVVGVLLALLGLTIWINEKRSSAATAFFVLTSSGVIWLLSYVGIFSARNALVARWWGGLENIGVVFIPSFFYLFTLIVTNRFAAQKTAADLAILISGLFALTIVHTDWFIPEMLVYPWGYYVRYGPVTIPFLIFFSVLMGLSLRIFWRESRRAVMDHAKRRYRAFVGAFAFSLLGSVDFLPAYGVSVYPFGYIGVSIFLVIIGQAIRRHRLVDITPSFAAEYIVERMADALVVVDCDGIIRIVNEAAGRILGWNPKTATGLTLAEAKSRMFTPEPFEVMMGRQRPWNYEVTCLDREGRELTLDVAASAIRDENGRPVALIYIARDITESRKANEALLQKNLELVRAKAAKEQLELFAFMASHDLREPLHKIMAYGDLIKSSSAGLSEKGKDYLDRLILAGKRMSELIADILELSKVAAAKGPYSQVVLDEVLADVLSDLEVKISETGADIRKEPLPVIAGDPVQLRQLFQNLLGNALKFTPKGIPPRVEITARDSGNGIWEISVEDHGVGFEESKAEKLFRPFERLHSRQEYPGSGIGLAICKKIVENHGGTIGVTSQPGQGSRFTIQLPKQGKVEAAEAAGIKSG